MKRLSPKLLMVVVLLLVVVVTATLVLDSMPTYVGGRTRNPDAYLLTFTNMNTAESHTMHLNAGDALMVSYTITGGKMDLTIVQAGDGGAVLYRGNNVDTARFTLPVEEEGDYTVQLKGKHARGEMSFTVQGPQ